MPECPEGMACVQVMPQPKTYSNSCSAGLDGATIISQGECKTPVMCPQFVPPVLNPEEQARGCKYTTSVNADGCTVPEGIMCPSPKMCPQYMPAPLSPEEQARGCKHTTTVDADGCTVPGGLKCSK